MFSTQNQMVCIATIRLTIIFILYIRTFIISKCIDQNYGKQIECAYVESAFLNSYEWPDISIVDNDHCISSCNRMGTDLAILNNK
jgi:hypothetical protein